MYARLYCSGYSCCCCGICRRTAKTNQAINPPPKRSSANAVAFAARSHEAGKEREKGNAPDDMVG